jgi:hypothetical protein
MPETKTILTLPRGEDTKNFAKFEVKFDRADKNKPSGSIYLPLDQAAGITQLTIVAAFDLPKPKK